EDVVVTSLCVFREEASAEDRIPPKEMKEIDGYGGAQNALRRSIARHVRRLALKRRHAAERLRLLFPQQKVRIADRRRPIETDLAVFSMQNHETVRIVKRKGLQEHSVRQAEDSRVRSDAQCENQNRRYCKHRVLAQCSQRVSYILLNALQCLPSPHLAHFFFE